MSIDLASTINFGDDLAVRSFFLDHSSQHQLYGTMIASTFSKSMPLFDLTDEGALNEWIEVMQGRLDQSDAERLQAWLNLHSALHVAELTALGIGSSDDQLETVNLGDEDQFDSWLYDHQVLHDTQDNALGV